MWDRKTKTLINKRVTKDFTFQYDKGVVISKFDTVP